MAKSIRVIKPPHNTAVSGDSRPPEDTIGVMKKRRNCGTDTKLRVL
jgi:hypothetical protein